MFENIIAQSAIDTIKNDLALNTLPPSILFSGRAASAKGSSALELARVLSCTAQGEHERLDIKKTAHWQCKCPSCEHHRHLAHPDLLCMGPRTGQVSFTSEILAGQTLFLEDTNNFIRKIFLLRAVRKLLLRFSPILHEGEAKFSKLEKTLGDLNDSLDELYLWEEKTGRHNKKIEKLIEGIVKDARKLEAEGISNVIPVSHIRNASYWLRMTPNGRRKILIIENAEKMNDAARNSLLKILEEPPLTASIILTSSAPQMLLPTILSRLRDYSFGQRSAQTGYDVISRIFHDENYIKELDADTTDNEHDNVAARQKQSGETIISLYLDKFLPVSGKILYSAAAYFLASTAASAIIKIRKKNNMRGNGLYDENLPALLVAIGKYAAPLAEQGGFGRPANDIKIMVGAVRAAAEKFETRSLFGIFLEKIYTILSRSFAGDGGVTSILYRDGVREAVREVRLAVEIYNQQIELSLENLAIRIIDVFAKGGEEN
jgi:DNA polymerase-3 subunit gamma/tau